MPKVSFVCSVHNAGKFLKPFLRSVLLQDFKDFEAIFVDAASRDGSREILQEYARQDPRLKVIEQDFISIAAAVNIGLKAAQGAYIARIDADNILFPSFLSDQIIFLDKRQDVDFVIADQLKIDARNKVLGMIPFVVTDYALKKHLLFKTALGGAPMVGKRQAFFDVGLYEETTVITEDRIFALKAKQSKKFASLNKINYAYRIHEQAITRRYKKNAEHLKKVKAYEERYIKTEDYYSDLNDYRDILDQEFLYKELILKKLANTVLYCGLRLADLGERNAAAKEIEKATLIFPPNKLLYNFFIWQVKRGKKELEAFCKKVDYWLPFKVDLLQLVPLKIWKKSLKSKEDQRAFRQTGKDYVLLLEKVSNEK